MALSELALTLSQCRGFSFGFKTSSEIPKLPLSAPTTFLVGATSSGGPAAASHGRGGGTPAEKLEVRGEQSRVVVPPSSVEEGENGGIALGGGGGGVKRRSGPGKLARLSGDLDCGGAVWSGEME